MKGNSFTAGLLSDLEAEQRRNTYTGATTFGFSESHIDPYPLVLLRKKVQVLKNISLDIQKGDFIGFRGESGSGKSTLFHLLLGFLQPEVGGIYVDGVSLSVDRLESWRSKIGYVSQQLFMIEGTLLDNIAMGVDGMEIDRDRAREAIRLASLDHFIKTLPQGLDTPIGEGGCLLSGGQRQRLGIARALYKQAEILMFDEATSSLDETTEHAINGAIVRLSEECPGLTLLVISHRSESLAICRKIVDIQGLNN